MANQRLYIDYETYYSTDFSLSKMTTRQYILDPRFEVIGAAIAVDDGPTGWYDADKLPMVLASFDWSTTQHVSHNCLTGDHEVRTPEGWVRLDQLQDNTAVMQYDAATGAMSYATPSKVTREPYTGTMLEWNTNFHKGCYTPNHRMYISTPDRKSWFVEAAAEVSGRSQNNTFIPTSGVYESPKQIDISTDLARVMEMVRADAHISKRGYVCMRLKKKRKLDRMAELLHAAGMEYKITVREGVSETYIHKCPTLTHIVELLGTGKSKGYRGWVQNLPLAARLAILDECRHWDGVRSYGPKSATIVHTAHKETATWLREMATMSGYCAKVVYDRPNTRGLSRPDSVLHHVTLRPRRRAKLVKAPKKVQFSGTVYCVTVPNEAFLVRRNGCTWVTGNTMFDGAITQWKYGYRPRLWMDTMGMAQAMLAAIAGGASLKAISKLLDMYKDSGALMNMRGKRAADVDKSGSDWARYTTYACTDVEMCRTIMKKLEPAFPKKELLVIDTLLRMYFDNDLRLDEVVLADALQRVRADSAAALARAGIPDVSVLRSRDKFADLLRSHGVTPPTKISPANGQSTYAFAKNDVEFAKLLDHSDPQVVALVEAKLNASSSLEETRTARFQQLSRIGGGVLNVPLRYSAAHTHRFGGSDNLNLQNLPRKSPLREAIVVPPGKKLVVVDASQIEARMLAWLAGCTSLTNAFAAGEDVYSTFASKIYHRPINKNDDPDERFIGKTGILGLGYGTGWAKMQWSLLTSPFYEGQAPDDFCQNMVNTYRNTYTEIPRFWKKMEHALHIMTHGQSLDVGPLKFRDKKVILPSGLAVVYPQLHHNDTGDWATSGYEYYSARYKTFKKIYGAALTENVTQALARIVITDAMLYMRATDPDYFCCLQVHDELGYLVPEHKAQQCYEDLMRFMNTRPSWAPDLPLAAEGGIATRYSEAK